MRVRDACEEFGGVQSGNTCVLEHGVFKVDKFGDGRFVYESNEGRTVSADLDDAGFYEGGVHIHEPDVYELHLDEDGVELADEPESEI